MRAAGATRGIDGGGGGGGLPLTGGTMQGPIDMGGFSIVNESLVTIDTAVSATTAAMGVANIYRATATGITITVSTADITAERVIGIEGRNALISEGDPITIVGEGGELIDGAASAVITTDYGTINLRGIGGALESVPS